METLTIGKLHSRYRLTASAKSQRDRLDRLVRESVGEFLEVALGRAGLPTDEEICIRSVHGVVRVRLSQADSALAVAWSLAIADEIREALANGDAVRYRSRDHALLDLVARAAIGDLGRSWAWRQMGLWRIGDHADRVASAGEAMRALCAEPHSAVRILAALARLNGHTEGFARLVTYAGIDRWTALARVVLGSATPQIWSALSDGADTSVRDSGRRALAVRIIAHSEILRAVLPLLQGRSDLPGLSRALAVLAIAEVEPAELCGASESVVRAVSAIADDLRVFCAMRDSSAMSFQRARVPDRIPERQRASKPERIESAQDDSEPLLGDSIVDPRVGGSSRAGGLLFFLRVAGQIGIPNQIKDRLPGRSTRVVLHRLAMMIAPVAADDAAALAFAGLSPGSMPPSQTDEALREDELAVIAALCDQLVGAVRERFENTRHATKLISLDNDALAALLWRRDAEVIADPGWIEIRFSHDDVSTQIRAAGLDLDPGWISWLGVVMRFVYA